MAPRSFAVVFVMMLSFTSGCGTVCNLVGGVIHPESEPRIYGGVQRDFETGIPMPSGPKAIPAAAVLLALGAGEVALSLAGDTATLPITGPLQRMREARDREFTENAKPSSAINAPSVVERLPVVPVPQSVDRLDDGPGEQKPSKED